MQANPPLLPYLRLCSLVCVHVLLNCSQLHSHWKNHVLFVDEEKSTLRFFHYDPNALPFYKQLLISIVIPLIIYLYGLFSAWSRRP